MAVNFPSLIPIRTVLSITGRGAPTISQEIELCPEKRRWIIMILLSCPGNLVRRRAHEMFCILCNEPVNNIFTHLLAFCTKTLNLTWRKQNFSNIISDMQCDSGSACPTLIYWLFMSESRFRLQRDYVDLILSLRVFPVAADI